MKRTYFRQMVVVMVLGTTVFLAGSAAAVTLEVTSGGIGTDSASSFDTGFTLVGAGFVISGVALSAGVGLVFPSPDGLHTGFGYSASAVGSDRLFLNGVRYPGGVTLSFTLDAPLLIPGGLGVFETGFTMTGHLTILDPVAGQRDFDLGGAGTFREEVQCLPPFCPFWTAGYSVGESPTHLLVLVGAIAVLALSVLRRRAH